MRRHVTVYSLALSLVLGVTPKALATDRQPDTFTTIDFPGASSTDADAINPRGDIVGNYFIAGVGHGFLLSGGEFTSIDFPDGNFTEANGINARGDIVGQYEDSAGVTHGYLLSRPEGHEDKGGDENFE